MELHSLTTKVRPKCGTVFILVVVSAFIVVEVSSDTVNVLVVMVVGVSKI